MSPQSRIGISLDHGRGQKGALLLLTSVHAEAINELAVVLRVRSASSPWTDLLHGIQSHHEKLAELGDIEMLASNSTCYPGFLALPDSSFVDERGTCDTRGGAGKLRITAGPSRRTCVGLIV